MAKKVDRYLDVNMLRIYKALFHSNQHTKFTESGVWTSPYLIPRKLFINWNKFEDHRVQLNQLANPSSLWAAGTGRRATNHPLSFHLPLFSPSFVALSRVQPSWHRSHQPIVTLDPDLHFIRSRARQQTHTRGQSHTHRFRCVRDWLSFDLNLFKYLGLINWNMRNSALILLMQFVQEFLLKLITAEFFSLAAISVCVCRICVYAVLWICVYCMSVCGSLHCNCSPLCDPLFSMKTFFVCREVRFYSRW